MCASKAKDMNKGNRPGSVLLFSRFSKFQLFRVGNRCGFAGPMEVPGATQDSAAESPAPCARWPSGFGPPPQPEKMQKREAKEKGVIGHWYSWVWDQFCTVCTVYWNNTNSYKRYSNWGERMETTWGQFEVQKQAIDHLWLLSQLQANLGWSWHAVCARNVPMIRVTRVTEGSTACQTEATVKSFQTRATEINTQ